MIILAEMGYSVWGTWLAVAYDMGKQALHLAHNPLKNYVSETHNPYPSGVTFRISDRQHVGYFRKMKFPGTAKLKAVFGDDNLCDAYARRGVELAKKQTRKHNAPDLPAKDASQVYAMLDIPFGSFVVGVFNHVCWDGSISWGQPIFPTYEDWLLATFEEALKQSDVYWVFKIHPKEKKDKVLHPKYNTKTFLVDMAMRKEAHNIKIIDDDCLQITSGELMKILNVGITVAGTTGYEMPSLGVASVIANAGVDAGLGFSIDALSTDQYLSILRNIRSVKRPSDLQVKKARAYLALSHDDENYIDFGELYKRKDGMDPYLNPFRVMRFAKKYANEFRRILAQRWW